MIQFDPSQLTERENYKLLVGSIIPRPVALISSHSEESVLNIAPFSYFSIVSTQPAILSVSVLRKNGQMKDTARNILATKEAVVHIVDKEMVVEANNTARALAPDVSELTVANFTPVQSEIIDVPGLMEARVRFETTFYQHIPIEREGEVTADLLLLEIKHYHVDEAIYDDGRINPEILAPISRLAGNFYSEIGPLHEIERPI